MKVHGVSQRKRNFRFCKDEGVLPHEEKGILGRQEEVRGSPVFSSADLECRAVPGHVLRFVLSQNLPNFTVVWV